MKEKIKEVVVQLEDDSCYFIRVGEGINLLLKGKVVSIKKEAVK